MNQPPSTLSRRRVFVGAGTVGAMAAAASLLPAAREPVQEAARPKPPENGGGYHLSEHVRQYYQTARV